MMIYRDIIVFEKHDVEEIVVKGKTVTVKQFSTKEPKIICNAINITVDGEHPIYYDLNVGIFEDTELIYRPDKHEDDIERYVAISTRD